MNNSIVEEISVVIPYFNDSKSIERCVNSVLSQTLLPREIIIIDDSSNDSDLIPESIMTNSRVKYLRNYNNMNGAYCRNFGVEISNSKYIAFLDADDYWESNHLKYHFEYLILKGVDFVYSNVISVNGNGSNKNRKVIDHETYDGDYSDLLLLSPPQTNSFFGKRETFLNVKFDVTLKRHQDYQLYMDMLQSNYDVKYLDVYTSNHCTSHRPLSSRYDFESALEFWKKYEHVVDRELYLNYLWLSLYLSFKTNGNIDAVLLRIKSYSSITLPNNLFGKVFTVLYFNVRYRLVHKLLNVINGD
ncbi:TPA: glycosyltransferase family 2 protein [Vibrio campbellii]|uniref:glycosyltransferase family 2 protein n=1 Tax=Vibrio campbellii TaxID=680 RepID=UPI00390B4620